jgi:cytosine/adenosine deaminase-related metal-dependent hydrolase
MSTLLLRHARWIYTCDDRHHVVEDGYVLVHDRRIADVGREPCPHGSADEVHDLSGCLVLPGLINLHHHFYQTLTRAIPLTQRARALDWLFGMYPVWAELDAESMASGALTAAAELLLSGATTSVDHSYLLPGEDGEVLDEEVRAVREAGLRLHLVRGCLPALEGNLAERLRPVLGERMDGLIDREETLFPRLERDIRRHHDDAPFSMLRIAVGPTGVTFANPSLMRRTAEVAAAHGCGLHTHYHPRDDERQLAERLHGRSPAAFLRDCGWLRPLTWFAHCTQLHAEDMALFAHHGCGVAHCPRTVLRLGYPLTPVSAMRRRAVSVGIGVDGPASNDGGSMLDSVRLALLLHRAGSPPETDPQIDWLTPYDALLMATRIPAAILGRGDLGQLAPGMAADLTAFDLQRVPYTGAVADPLGALLMGGPDTRPAITVVDGRVRVRRGVLVGLDEATIVARANAAAERMLDAAERRTGLRLREHPGRGPFGAP